MKKLFEEIRKEFILFNFEREFFCNENEIRFNQNYIDIFLKDLDNNDRFLRIDYIYEKIQISEIDFEDNQIIELFSINSILIDEFFGNNQIILDFLKKYLRKLYDIE